MPNSLRNVVRLPAAVALLGVGGVLAGTGRAQVAAQPLAAQVRRVIEAMDFLGSPLPQATIAALDAAAALRDDPAAVAAIQAALDPHCLVVVDINPESRVKVARGGAPAQLVEHGWRQFLVKVTNQAGVTAPLAAVSPNALSLFESGTKTASDRALRPDDDAAAGAPPPAEDPAGWERERWLDLRSFTAQPMQKTLSGLGVEYCVLGLYSKDAGQREAKLAFDVGQGTQDLGFRSTVDILFECAPAHALTLRVRDVDGKPTTAAFVIRDHQGRVYPALAKRLAPDFAFQPQVYRGDGETVRLPAGAFTIECARGPEYLVQLEELVMAAAPQAIEFRLQRWIDPAATGWWSGDHHIHAAGCAHYDKPTEGVHAADMLRHCLGEDLKVGCNLTWGPCFDYQKQFFTGALDKVSRPPYLLRYDVEVSGFGSHKSGHLCLLRLQEQLYPGGDSDRHWPTLGLNTLRWAKKQGAVCGPAHSGFGLEVQDTALPSYEVPAFDSIGACETIADVTHEVPGPDGALVPAIDFISTADTPCRFELNIWYHLLNCGFRPRASGETDFPCIYGERVGIGRSYVKVEPPLDFDRWCEGIRQGRSYVSDGRSHLLEFAVGGVAVGEKGSELRLAAPGRVALRATVAALLDATPLPKMVGLPHDEKPYWHLERARIAGTREVPVEVVVNGRAVASRNIVADGTARAVEFEVEVERSAWVALRILYSSHSNPVFVLVGDKPIRASRRSAQWCIAGVEKCRAQKWRFIAEGERADATAAYDHAAATYRKILAQCEIE